MLEEKVVSQCISADYCRGWNDAVDAMPRWISVEERLPEDEKDVAVIVKLQKGNWMYLTAFRLPCGGWWINRGAGLDYAEVTHWMPLPPAPKEESTC